MYRKKHTTYKGLVLLAYLISGIHQGVLEHFPVNNKGLLYVKNHEDCLMGTTEQTVQN
jgi:hypothetical protein